MTKVNQSQEIIKMTAQLDKIITTKDGGGKITFEFGHDSISAIQELQKLNGTGGINLALAIVAFDDINL